MEVRGLDLTSKIALLKARSEAGTMTDSGMQEALSPPPCNKTQIRLPEGQKTQCLECPMSTSMRDEAVQKRCVGFLGLNLNHSCFEDNNHLL